MLEYDLFFKCFILSFFEANRRTNCIFVVLVVDLNCRLSTWYLLLSLCVRIILSPSDDIYLSSYIDQYVFHRCSVTVDRRITPMCFLTFVYFFLLIGKWQVTQRSSCIVLWCVRIRIAGRLESVKSVLFDDCKRSYILPWEDVLLLQFAFIEERLSACFLQFVAEFSV